MAVRGAFLSSWLADQQRRADCQRVADVAVAIDRIITADVLDRDAVAALCGRETYAIAHGVPFRALGGKAFHPYMLIDAALVSENAGLRTVCELRLAGTFLPILRKRESTWRKLIEDRNDGGVRRLLAVLCELAWFDADAEEGELTFDDLHRRAWSKFNGRTEQFRAAWARRRSGSGDGCAASRSRRRTETRIESYARR